MRLSGQVYGVVSAPDAPPRGSGKTFIALQLALRQAEDLNFGICCNFDLNGKELLKYLRACRYVNLMKQFEMGRIIVRPTINKGQIDIENFLKGGRCVFLLDEAAIFANSRSAMDKKSGIMQFLADIAQVRKDGIRVWWIAQVYGEVDKQIRNQTDFIVEANSLLRYNEQLKADAMWIKLHLIYKRNKYEMMESKRESWTGLKLMFKQYSNSIHKIWGFIEPIDRQLFKVYQSFGRLDKNPKLYNIPNFEKIITKIDYNEPLGTMPYRVKVNGNGISKKITPIRQTLPEIENGNH